ncbi:hypothetical protein PHLGIDRAFT_448394 [Phlebiopsis gigantea 11061_1 CR5-6]|uniref:C3H1-type domain-containing protein n=1 Tax=Phlebiopsis gigantea (strain 11061_1 CR5-6) TaxID=745531 RepID=A0A0C3SA25_PHLG1|nr:hypothetical protein PHLGIDRAFT_448394 [Phlebiopsis gigantea 11061_1 CR5-6]
MHDGRAFYSTRQLSMRPMYPIPYPPPCYPYPPMAHNDAAMYHPQMYYPVARRDPYSDMLPLESHILKMSLDNEKVPVKSTQPAPPVPPPTPSSTATEASSPTSTTSAHFAGSESARLLEEQQAPRERANSCGSFYRTKPCKFFHERGSCVKGNRCNFIHDYNQDRRGSVSESDSQPQLSDTTAHFSSRRRRVPKRPLHVKVEDRDKRSNFYPVMWRVISGRTMMGGPRRPGLSGFPAERLYSNRVQVRPSHVR